MAGEGRARQHAGSASPVESAVLVPVFRDLAGDLRVVVILRASGGRHGGQIAFPGGKTERGDADLLHTAIRESHEEIGLRRERIRYVEPLPVVATRSTGFRISPFLAFIERPRRWDCHPREVAAVLEPSVAHLSDPANARSVVEPHPRSRRPERIDYIALGEHRLWGASYRILEPLLPRLRTEPWREA